MKDDKTNNQGPLYLVLASLCFSLGGLCISFIPWGAMSIIGIRALLGALVSVIYYREFKLRLTKANLLIAVSFSATTIMFVFANKLTSAAAAILLQFCAPIFIILIELFFNKKKPLLEEIVAVFLTLLGMLLFFADKLEPGNMLGNILAILSGVTYAGVFVFNKNEGGSTKDGTLIGLLFNSIIGLPFAFFQVTADPVAWFFVIILGVFQVGVAYLFFAKGIKHTTALLACLITALEPVLNPLWVALATGEKPGPYAFLGGLVIVATVVIYNIWQKKAQSKLG